MRFESGRRWFKNYGRIIWAPTITFHDPNPPITIEDGPGLNDTVNEVVSAVAAQDAQTDYNASVTESVTAADSQSSSGVFSDSVTETVTATDDCTGVTQSALSDSTSETVTASESSDAVIIPAPPPLAPVTPTPGPLYGLSPIGTSTGSSALAVIGHSTSSSGLAAIGTAGDKDSLKIVRGPIP